MAWSVFRVNIVGMLYARIIIEYPTDPFTGWPAETIDLSFALGLLTADAAAAHEEIRQLIRAGEVFELPCADGSGPLRFSPELIRLVAVCDGGAAVVAATSRHRGE